MQGTNNYILKYNLQKKFISKLIKLAPPVKGQILNYFKYQIKGSFNFLIIYKDFTNIIEIYFKVDICTILYIYFSPLSFAV